MNVCSCFLEKHFFLTLEYCRHTGFYGMKRTGTIRGPARQTGRAGTGLDGTGWDQNGLEGTGLDGTRMDWTGRDMTRMDGTGRDGTGRDGTRMNCTGRNQNGLEGRGRDWTQQDWTKQDWTGRNNQLRYGTIRGRDKRGNWTEAYLSMPNGTYLMYAFRCFIDVGGQVRKDLSFKACKSKRPGFRRR